MSEHAPPASPGRAPTRKVVALLLLASACAVNDPSASSVDGTGGMPSRDRPPDPQGVVTVTLASDESWFVYTSDPSAGPLPEDPTVLAGLSTATIAAGPGGAPGALPAQPALAGRARRVCADAVTPPSCAKGAVLLSPSPSASAHGAWSAALDPIPGAAWVWASVGSADLADDREYWFTGTFDVAGVPGEATLWLAADDWAEVLVNGVVVPLADGARSVGSRASKAASVAALKQLAVADLAPFLRLGRNVLAIHAANGPGAPSCCPGDCTYAENPAGVVFGGSIRFTVGAPAP